MARKIYVQDLPKLSKPVVSLHSSPWVIELYQFQQFSTSIKSQHQNIVKSVKKSKVINC